jgi:acyl-coenzyme A thioesterase PaaI-like protein
MPPLDADAETLARTRLGAAIRNLGHAVVGHEADPEHLQQLASSLESMSASLQSGVGRSRTSTDAHWGDDVVPEGAVLLSHGDRPFAGPYSPWSVDMTVRRVGDEAVGVVTYRSGHEGAPGRCHGGVVAGVFDDVLGYVLQVHQIVAFTGTISVRYERPTPLFVPIQYRARLDRVEGRKLFMTADCWHDDTRIASATATFISVDIERFGDSRL